MLIVLELEEVRSLFQHVGVSIDPDFPHELETSLATLERVTDLLNAVLDDDMDHLTEDDAATHRAVAVVTKILEKLNLYQHIQSMRVIDRFGCLVIHVKPGALACLH